MEKRVFKMRSKVVVYPGPSAWRFLIIPQKEGSLIKKTYGKSARGWGSIPVTVTLGKTEWRTSLFPDKKSGTYLLPLKASVRKTEGILDTTDVLFELRIGL